MELKGTFQVDAIKKQTKAKFFKDLQVGEQFTLKYEMTGSYGYAPYVSIWQRGNKIHINSTAQLKSNLEKFEIRQVA